MPIGKAQGLKVLPNDITSYVILVEPPAKRADPHVRWCEREWLAAALYSIKAKIQEESGDPR